MRQRLGHAPRPRSLLGPTAVGTVVGLPVPVVGPVEQRLTNYNDAMRRLSERFPEDFEAQVYYALTLQASAPKTDKTYSNQLKAAAILEKQLQQNPQHPGVAHYLIHAYDYPPLAEKGLAAARRYAGIAPAASHARERCQL